MSYMTNARLLKLSHRMLKKIEWGSRSGSTHGNSCLFCHRYETDGHIYDRAEDRKLYGQHKVDCEMKIYLADYKKKFPDE